MESNQLQSAPPDGGYGWVVVLATVIINSSLYPLVQCIGIIFEEKFHDMGISATEIFFLLHFHSSIVCILGLASGPLLKIYDYKELSYVGVTLVCSGIMLTTIANSYMSYIVTIALLMGSGLGILYTATSVAVNSYFKKRLTLAMSICVTGVGLTPIIMPQLVNFLLDSYGLKGTIMLLGGYSLNGYIGAMLLKPFRPTVSHGKLTNGTIETVNLENGKGDKQEDGSEQLLGVYNETTITERDESFTKKLFEMFDAELLKDRKYVIIAIGLAVSYVSEVNFILTIPFILSELGKFSRKDVAFCMSIMAGADILARLAVPFISHRHEWSSKVMYAVSLVGFCIGRTVMALFTEMHLALFSMFILMGVSKGAKAVYQAIILPQHVPLDKLANAMGFLLIINGTISLLVGPLLGTIHDITNSYLYVLHSNTLLTASCILLWSVEGVKNRCQAKQALRVES